MLVAMARDPNDPQAGDDIYHYVDDDGRDVVTNDLASVPPQYLGKLEIAGAEAVTTTTAAAMATTLLPADFHAPSFALGAGSVALLAAGLLALAKGARAVRVVGGLVVATLLGGLCFVALEAGTEVVAVQRRPIDEAKAATAKTKSRLEQMRVIEKEIEGQP